MNFHAALLAFALLLSPTVARTQSEHPADPGSGLKHWEWDAGGILFQLTQRLPDQTRAFFLARGFDADSVELFATSCVFQSMFRNTGPVGSGMVKINLADWRIISERGESQLKRREDWQTVWDSRALSKSARIAFEWSLLPTVQEYAPEDYNWGMTSYGLPPGSVFDITFSWQRGDQNFHGRLKDVRCAADIHPQAAP